jgi:hypothetical protein
VLQGDNAFVQTVVLPGGCDAHEWTLQVKRGNPAPEANDKLVLYGRTDGGPWVVVKEIFGTGAAVPYSLNTGNTQGLGLDGDTVEWRIEVVGNELNDVFTIDDFTVACDTDADGLEDCIESTAAGFDLLVADADGDGWMDGDEYAEGTDPYEADTDIDTISDPNDNCPVNYNPSQSDSDGNGLGDACDLSIHDDFGSGILDPVVWLPPVSNVAPSSLYALSGTYSLDIRGTGILEARPINFRACTQVGWDFALKLGPTAPATTDHLFLEVFNGTDWTILLDVPGTGGTTTGFTPRIGATTNTSALQSATRMRLRNNGQAATDDFFVDDLVIGCDSDGDLIPNYKEQYTYGTDPNDADTDNDGMNDGAEILANRNPLVP